MTASTFARSAATATSRAVGRLSRGFEPAEDRAQFAEPVLEGPIDRDHAGRSQGEQFAAAMAHDRVGL